MDKRLKLGLGVVLVSVIFGGLYLNLKKEKVIVKNTPEAVVKMENQKYIEYINPQSLETKNIKRILFFYANWCPTCIPVDKEFRENEAKFPKDVVIIRVNYNDPDTDNNERELVRKYGITYQHTFVQIDEKGNEITKWNGGGIDELISNLK